MKAGYGIARWNCTRRPAAPSGHVTESSIATIRSLTVGVSGSSAAYAVSDWSRIHAGPAGSFRTSTRWIENSTAAQVNRLPLWNRTPDLRVKLYVIPSGVTSARFVTSGTFVASIGSNRSAFAPRYQMRLSATFWTTWPPDVS